jgi:hypothetical protein
MDSTLESAPSAAGSTANSVPPWEWANPQVGYKGVIPNLRSLTMHPLGLLLTEFLHREKHQNLLEGFPEALTRHQLPESKVGEDIELIEGIAHVVENWAKPKPKVDDSQTELKDGKAESAKKEEKTQVKRKDAADLSNKEEEAACAKNEVEDQSDEDVLGDALVSGSARAVPGRAVEEEKKRWVGEQAVTKALVNELCSEWNGDDGNHQDRFPLEFTFYQNLIMVWEAVAKAPASVSTGTDQEVSGSATGRKSHVENKGSAATTNDHNNSASTDQDLPLLLIQMGLDSDHDRNRWWKKLDQVFVDVQVLSDSGQLQKPMLVNVLNLGTRPPGVVTGRFGVFLVTPKAKKEFRVALVWHKDCDGLYDVARYFVKVLRASELVLKWNRPDFSTEDLVFENLGPHCCRIGEEVRVSKTVQAHAPC